MLPDSADAKGRHGLALYVVSEGYIRQEIILDRKTYRYLGSRSITIADHAAPPPGETIEKGSVLGLSALLTAAPVNGPDERP
ncbi:hypothetical protein [Thermomonospora umbrina]|uniref:hypothetical protein n=1 Tax=Thermomonospora umbrina TaxID=111806 RepID=UPI001476C745|nr:hypothetical protein [Thermomonospora umbrina]